MQITIVRDDNTVIVNGKALQVECGDLPAIFRVIQWTGAEGWIEYRQGERFVPNLKITDFSPYGYLVDRWRLALSEERVAEKEAEVLAVEVEAKNLEHRRQQREAFDRMITDQRLQAELAREEKTAVNERIAALERQNIEMQERLVQAEERLAKARET